jgi:hypothetical protein
LDDTSIWVHFRRRQGISLPYLVQAPIRCVSWAILLEYSVWGAKLSTYFHAVPRVRIHGIMNPLQTRFYGVGLNSVSDMV